MSKKLHEEFKLYEDIWEIDDTKIVPKTSSLWIALNTYKGNTIVDKKGVPHIEAYKELVKTLKTLSDKDTYDLFINWTADAKTPGDGEADVILGVDAATTLIDMGEDPDENNNGYEGGLANPANRLVLPCAYLPEDLGLPTDAYDFIEGLLDIYPVLGESKLNNSLLEVFDELDNLDQMDPVDRALENDCAAYDFIGEGLKKTIPELKRLHIPTDRWTIHAIMDAIVDLWLDGEEFSGNDPDGTLKSLRK